MDSEVIVLATGARYFERIIGRRYLVHEYTEGLASGVVIFDLKSEERFTYDNAYFMVIDHVMLILTTPTINITTTHCIGDGYIWIYSLHNILL